MLVINDDCINCDACVAECPNHAIYEPDEEWTFADGTSLSGLFAKADGTEADADKKNEAQSDEFFYIVADKCTECQGFHDEPQCVSVCPADSIHVSEEHPETVEELLAKKAVMHG